MNNPSNTHIIQLTFRLTETLGMKSVTVDLNTTDLPSDSELIKKLAFTILKSLSLNKEDIAVQNLLNELGIPKQ